MALTKDAPIREQESEFTEHGVLASAQIYEGSMAGLSSGYARALAAGDIFLGHALENVLGTSSGVKKVRVRSGVYALQVTLASVAVTDIGKPVFASADATYTLTPGSNSYVGRVLAYVTTNTCIVEFHPLAGADYAALTSGEKVAFFGTTPIVQPAHIADTTSGTTVDTNARASIAAILVRLEIYGLSKLS